MIRKLTVLLIAVLLLVGTTPGALLAATGSPVELTADTIEYDSVQGIMTAQGGVRMVQDSGVLTGAAAEYNTKTKEAVVTGNVQATKDDAVLTAPRVRSYEDNHLIADGGATLVKGQNTLIGPQIDYYADKQYALVNNDAHLQMPDGIMTADRLEAFMAEDRAVGQGHVHIVSETRKLDATSEQAVYYGIKGAQSNQAGQGKIVLTGNPRAVQDGNVLTGNSMTIYLDDKAMDSEGRSKLVVRPQPQSQPQPQ